MSRKHQPPQNLEAEDALLGAILLSPDTMAKVASHVEASDFFKPSNQSIFDACVALFTAGDLIDVVTVSHELKQRGELDSVGGSHRLIQLQSSAPSISGASKYAEIVKDLSLLRNLALIGSEIVDGVYSAESAAVAIRRAEAEMFHLGNSLIEQTTAHARDALFDRIDNIERAYSSTGHIGLETGYHDLDDMLLGLQPGGLYVVAARPGAGKTVVATNIACHAAVHQDVPTLFCSIEMGREEVLHRIICSEGEINSNDLKEGRLNAEDWTALGGVVSSLSGAPLWIDDNANTGLIDIRSSAMRVKASARGLGLIVIDYLGLMRFGKAESTQESIGNTTRGLKILARELQIPIVLLAQLNRGLESRMDKRPQLQDLRSSGAIEADADAVIFIYRDEMYNDESDDLGLAELIVAKHRAGETGTIKVGFAAEWQRFLNLSDF